MAGGPPPPPYSSLGLEHNHTASSRPKEFEIGIVDALRQGDGVSAYVAYKIVTRSTREGWPRTVECIRRFSHFSWLSQKLSEKHKGCIVPALPEKSTMQKFQMGTEFIQQRQRALQVFLNKVAAHPVLKESKELQHFLTANEQEWMLEMARWQAETNATKPAAMNGALQWLKSLQHSAQNMVTGRSDDAAEDADYVKVREYMGSLEAHLVEAHKQAARLVRKEAELSTALAEFGIAAEQLGKFDDGPVRAAFDVLCARAGQIAMASRQRADAMASSFEAPLKEYGRTIKSVQTAMSDRSSALSQFCQAKSDLDAKKIKLAKLRATPGLKEDKVGEAEREVSEAEARVSSTKIAYDTIVARMTEELNRFQKERAAEMSALLKDFALAQAQSAAENAKAWSEMLAEMTAQTASVQLPAVGGAAAQQAAGPSVDSSLI